jgi:hypothetical protein
MKRHGAILAPQYAPPVCVDEREELTLIFEAYASGGEEGLRRVLNELHPELEQKRFRLV